MSISSAFATSPLATSLPWRLFVRAIFVAGAALGVGCTIYVIEKYLFAPRHRFVENPAEVMTRTFGTAHFLVGWLFLATSPRLRSASYLAQLTGWLGLGLVLCLCFSQAGGLKNPLALLAFYSLFLVHDCGDQVRLFQRSERGHDASLASLRWFFTLLLITTLAGLYLVTGTWLRKDPWLADVPQHWPVLAWGCLAAATMLVGCRFLRDVRASHGGLDSFLTSHLPLVAILSSIYGILTFGSMLGSLGLNLIILLHVTTWLVHVHHQLGEKPRTTKNFWTWLRHTPAGFLALHLSLVAVILLLFALRVQVWERAGWFCVLFSASTFPYWSLLHISTACWRGR